MGNGHTLLSERDQLVRRTHELLLERGIAEVLADDDDDVRRWLDCDLASLAEGHLHRQLDVRDLRDEERREVERPVAGESGLRDPRREYRSAFWLLDEGRRVGTLAVSSIVYGWDEVALSSLYVFPELRGRGVAARALDAVYDVAIESGAGAVRLDVNWCWQHSLRFYLRRRWWVGNWKHNLVLVRSRHLEQYDVSIDGRHARFSVLLPNGWETLIEAEHRGTVLGWVERPAFESISESLPGVHGHAPGTFALHLAAAGWPLVRSPALWERRHDWCNAGEPEGLMYKIARFEAVERERGFEVRTPRIPGVDYEAV